MRAFFDIDTQLDFVFPAGALYAPGAERVIPVVALLNRFAAANGIPVFSTVCAHGENAAEFRVWPPHCVVGTAGQLKPAATLLEKRATVPNHLVDLTSITAPQLVLEKDALDLFTNPNLDALLTRFGITECVVYGVLTEFCVKHAIMGLLARGLRVQLVSDATAHLSDTAAAQVVSDFSTAGGAVIASSQLTA